MGRQLAARRARPSTPHPTCDQAVHRALQDMRNLIDAYMDVAFHPRLPTDPRIFQSEAWHYEVTKQASRRSSKRCRNLACCRLEGSRAARPLCGARISCTLLLKLVPRWTHSRPLIRLYGYGRSAVLLQLDMQSSSDCQPLAALPQTRSVRQLQGNLSIEGVVINEMRGDYSSPDTLHATYSQRYERRAPTIHPAQHCD